MSIEKAKDLFGAELSYDEQSLLWTLEQLNEQKEMVLESKNSNLVESIEKLLKEGKFPLVDKKLRVIFGVASEHHPMLRGALYRFHTAADKERSKQKYDGRGPDNYVHEGMGYYISSMQPGRIIVGQEYRPDKQDNDLFMLYEVFTVPKGMPVWQAT